MADGGIRPDIDSLAISSPVVNETSGDERKVRAGPAAFPVNGINGVRHKSAGAEASRIALAVAAAPGWSQVATARLAGWCTTFRSAS